MDFLAAQNSDERFDAYVDGLAGVIGHADRGGPLKAYCAGLLRICSPPMRRYAAAGNCAPSRVRRDRPEAAGEIRWRGHAFATAAYSDERIVGE